MRSFRFPTLTRTVAAACGLALVSALATHAAGAATIGFRAFSTNVGLRPRLTALPARVDPNSRRYDAWGRLISHIVQPLSWSAVTTSPCNKVTYNLEFLGTSPLNATRSNMPLYLIAWRFEFSNGMVTDARATACGDSGNHPVIGRE